MPEAGDAGYADKIGAYLGVVLPVYGNNFVMWWRERFLPEMQRNFDYIEGMLERKDELTLADMAVLLEDAIDMHDRHWKIHWMLNFAQLSATLNLKAVMQKTHGKVDDVVLGRLQNYWDDRNWDKIRALWEMKEEVKGDADLRAAFDTPTAAQIVPALQATERGRRFVDQRVVPYQKEFGWHAVWSHEFVYPSFREDMNPVIQLVRDQYASDYDYPSKVAALKADIDAAAVEILQGLEGEALDILMSTARGSGLEAWRRLSRRYDGTGPAKLRGSLTAILTPDRLTLRTMSAGILQWEERVRVYEQRTKELLGERVKASIRRPSESSERPAKKRDRDGAATATAIASNASTSNNSSNVKPWSRGADRRVRTATRELADSVVRLPVPGWQRANIV